MDSVGVGWLLTILIASIERQDGKKHSLSFTAAVTQVSCNIEHGLIEKYD